MNSAFPRKPAGSARLSRFRRIAVTVLVLLFLFVASLPAQSQKKPRRSVLPFNETIAATIAVIDELPAYREWDLEVTDEVFALDIRIDHAPADLDILLFDDSGDLVAYSEYSLFNEELRISRISDTGLTTGRYRLEIAYQYSRPPRVEGSTLTEIPFELYVGAITPESVSLLRPGDTVTGRLDPAGGMLQIYRVEVPTGSPALRLDISDTDADIDLFLRRDIPAIDPFQAEYWSQSVRSTEVLIVDRNSAPPLQPGTYYVTVIDQISDNYPAEYRLSVHDEASAPSRLLRDTTPPRAVGPMDRPLLATVEILTFNGGGSGVVVHPDGYILTNRHVILDGSGAPAREITIGYSRDYGRPPEEAYLAEVIETSEDRDLALLRIVSGRYGESLPEDAEFVYLEPRFDTVPGIGESLRFIGYPSIGGTGSRASITFTRGTVAGYQNVPFGRLIKTDGEINEGSSGGAALDESFRLVGLPTEVVGLDASQLAYIYPVSAIPASWRRIIAR